MSKIIDITDKLSFEGNPKLVVKGTELEVNSDAPTVLLFMQLMGKVDGEQDMDAEALLEAYELLFSEETREKIKSLGISFKDLMVIVQSAVGLINGGNNEGEN
nr:MAG TPA: hypothetical protein [Caudoviricetes sp.]